LSFINNYVFLAAPPEILDRHFRHIGFDEKGIEGYAMAVADIKRKTVSPLSVESGYNLMLMCTVTGKPTPSITWRRNGQSIKNDSRHMILPSGVLLVRQVDTKLSGQYKCVASNIVGKDQGSVHLIVKNEATGKKLRHFISKGARATTTTTTSRTAGIRQKVTN